MPQDGAPLNAPRIDMDELLHSMSSRGFYIQDEFLSPILFNKLRSRLLELWEEDAFKRAGIGKMTSFQKDITVRGDHVFWIDKDKASGAVKSYIHQVGILQQQMSRGLFLPLREFESHFAVYPSGTFYKRHSDNFQKQNHRIISVVLYLNENWTPEEGGRLMIYPDDGEEVSVDPIGGRLVIFRSDLEHEVLPCHAPRYSITGWMRDQPVGLGFL